MHLRWIYVMDHAPLFAALTALFVISMVAVVFLVGGVVGDVMLGAVPTLFAVAVWAITNNAGYPNRDPVSLPHQRPEIPAESGPAWDPFAGQRKAVVGGDPFATDADGETPPETVEPAIDDSPTAEDETEDTDASAATPRTHAPKARRAIEDNQPVRTEPAPRADKQPANVAGAAPAAPATATGKAQVERTTPADKPGAPAADPAPRRRRKRHRAKKPEPGPRPGPKNRQDKPAAATTHPGSEEAQSPPPVQQPAAASPEIQPDQTEPPAAQPPAKPAKPPNLPKAPRVEKPAPPPADTKPRRARKQPATPPSEGQKAATPSDRQEDRPSQNPAEAARRAAARANREARTRHEAPVAEAEDPSTSEAPLSPAEAAKRAAAARKRNRKRKAS